MNTQSAIDFSGADYRPTFDRKRLNTQLGKIYDFIKDGAWRTLQDIEDATGYPQSSISAQLRNLRKPQFGSHIIDRRRHVDRDVRSGLYQYRLSTTVKP